MKAKKKEQNLKNLGDLNEEEIFYSGYTQEEIGDKLNKNSGKSNHREETNHPSPLKYSTTPPLDIIPKSIEKKEREQKNNIKTGALQVNEKKATDTTKGAPPPIWYENIKKREKKQTGQNANVPAVDYFFSNSNSRHNEPKYFSGMPEITVKGFKIPKSSISCMESTSKPEAAAIKTPTNSTQVIIGLRESIYEPFTQKVLSEREANRQANLARASGSPANTFNANLGSGGGRSGR